MTTTESKMQPKNDEQHKETLVTDQIKSEPWPIKYGSTILLACGIVTGNWFNQHYRKVFRMGKAFRMTTWIPVAIASPLAGALTHASEVSYLVRTKKSRFECPVCYEMRAGAIQTILGAVYPLLAGFVFCSLLTKRYRPENLKKFHLDKKNTSLIKQFINVSPKGTALPLMILNFGVAVVVAQLELQAVINSLKENTETEGRAEG